MQTNDFLDRMHAHTKAIYENGIEQVTENGKITNWLLGLAGGALLLSFNKYDTIENKNITFIIVQALIFIATIFAGYLHRIKTKAYRDYTISIIRMFEFLKIEFEAILRSAEFAIPPYITMQFAIAYKCGQVDWFK
jgi:hypothetical protein